MIDRILVDLGMASMPEIGGKKLEEMRIYLTDQLRDFLSCGGQVTWDLWMSMSFETRDCLHDAAASVRAETWRSLLAEMTNPDSARESKIDAVLDEIGARS